MPRMNGSVLVAIAAAIGNLLQGWDNATIAGAVLYIKREFNLESQPTMEGLIVAMSLIGATIITTFSGAVADWIGRRPLLILSSVLYFISGLAMLFSPNVYILLLARLIDGFGVGLAVTLVPIYISETAPAEIRGLLNTLPQFTGSVGMFASYCMVFVLSLTPKPEWRLMLGFLSIPSLVYFLLMLFFLPESPRWLVSKGRMAEAKVTLQKLRGQEDVSGEMALLIEGLEVGVDIAIEKYIIGPAMELTDEQTLALDKDKIKLYGAEIGHSWVAHPVAGQSTLGVISRHGSLENHKSNHFIDPIVTLFGSVHENIPDTMGSMRSTLFPNFGSMFSAAADTKADQWDEENNQGDGGEYIFDGDHGADSDDNIQSPLLSRQATGNIAQQQGHGSILSIRNNSNFMQGNFGETVSGMDIGGGWQLAYKWNGQEGVEGNDGEVKRIYMHQEAGHGGLPGSRCGSIVSLPVENNELVQTAALVSHSALYSKDQLNQQTITPSKRCSADASVKGTHWSDLFESGVKHALIVGVGLQLLQQFAGINGVLYYTPQILEQAGVEVLLSNLGISSDSASILISALTTLLMLPCIAIAMRLMDISGRRRLLLNTIPILIMSLILLVISNIVNMNTFLHAILSTFSVILYFCCFVMGFGPVPNILCAEIFPDWHRVEEDCRKAIKLDPSSFKGHYILGIALVEKNEHTEAIKHLEKALHLGHAFNPEDRTIQAIRTAISKAKYTIWEQESTVKSCQLRDLREACRAALEEQLLSKISHGINDEKRMVEETEICKRRVDFLSKVFDEAEALNDQLEVPDYLCCKISLEIFTDPVITPCGITYERAALLDHLRKVGPFEPTTRKPLQACQLVPNLAIKEAVLNFLNKNRWAYKSMEMPSIIWIESLCSPVFFNLFVKQQKVYQLQVLL